MKKFITGLLTLALLLACSVSFGSTVAKDSKEQKSEFVTPKVQDGTQFVQSFEYVQNVATEKKILTLAEMISVCEDKKETLFTDKDSETGVVPETYRTARDALNYR